MRAFAKSKYDGSGTDATRPWQARDSDWAGASERLSPGCDEAVADCQSAIRQTASLRYRNESTSKSKILAGPIKCSIKCATKGNPAARAQEGAVLLEVVLALVLFVAAATIIGSALNTSANGVERLRLSVHAADLATSVLSELQIGSRNAGDGSPEPFAPPFDTWMWQVTTLPVEEVTQTGSSTTGTAGGLQGGLSATDGGLVKVEVTVRDTESDFVHRLSQIMSATSIRSGSERSGTQLF